MPKKMTEKSKYKSSVTGEYVTDGQYIAEILVKREAHKLQVNTSQHFWNVAPWKAKFQSQVTVCYKLLKKYSAKAIIQALEKNKWMYSLRSKNAESLIKSEQLSIDEKQKIFDSSEGIEKAPVTTNRITSSKKSRLSKLK